MALIALLFGIFIAGISILGVLVPASFLLIVRTFIQVPRALYVVAAFRVVLGIVLIRVAPVSRAPRVLRVVGVFVLVAGIITPLFSVERVHAIMDWWEAQGAIVIRLWAAIGVAFGAFLIHAVRPDRRVRS
jgi:hypothetical protein